MPNILVTGSNRGIGLEFVRQLANRADTRVFAACREPASAEALNQLAAESAGRVVVVPLQVDDPDSIAHAVAIVRAQTDSLDVLINNAGVNPPRSQQTLGAMSLEGALAVFKVNTFGVMLVTQAFVPLLKHGSRVINLSSGMGSIENKDYGGSHLYSSSKAALNMFSRGAAAELQGQGIVCIALDPGWVRTDMGGSEADLAPSESIGSMLKLIDGLTLNDSGKYLCWDGSGLPW